MRRLSLLLSIAAIASTLVIVASARPKPDATRTVATTEGKVTVKISGFQFDPKVLTVAPGTTVEWINEGGRHSVVADDGSFKSAALKQGDKFEHKFDKAGTFAYHCEFHGEKGGKDMAGKIVVKAGAKK